MTLIETIQEILRSADYLPVLAEVEERHKDFAPLIVPFRPDEMGRELAVFIEVMPFAPDPPAPTTNVST